MAPQGAKKGAKWGKGAHLLTNSYKNLQIWLDMIFNMRNMILGWIFIIMEYFIPFRQP